MKKLIVVVLCILFGCFIFAGCAQSTITFQRDSKFGEFMDNIQGTPKPKVKKSSGLVIYRDENKPTQRQSSSSGYSDMNFDLPIKF